MVKDIRFADDQGMVASSERGLQSIMDRLEATAGNCGMKINTKKSKVMKVSRNIGGKMNITIGRHKIEQIESFKYLGSTITEDRRCEQEIEIRIALAKEAFNKREGLLLRKFK